MSDQIVIYQSPDGTTGIEVHLEAETVWLTQDQMAELFGRERSVITKHLRNVFREGELDKTAVRAKFAHTAPDGKKYQTQFYNLDAILSVGYRVNSKRGTQFRQWATRILRDHLVQGFTVNQARIAEKGLSEMQQAVELLARTLDHQALIALENAAGKVVGIEIKAGKSVNAQDFKGLQTMSESLGPRFHRGIVLYTGSEGIPFGKNMQALPVSALWTLGALKNTK